MFNIIKPGTNINFVGRRWIFLGISIAAVALTVVLFFTKGLNYGIDFTGGAEVHLKVPATWNITELRSNLEQTGVANPRVQQVGALEDNEYLVRAQGNEKSLKEVTGKIRGMLEKSFPEGGFEVLRDDVVGPAAGGILRRKGFLAMFYALLVILIYVAFRFDSRYAPGAILALFHDSLVIVGVFILTGRQFDLTILAALLALIGYSNNDTIIVFDRVRETLYLKPKLSIEEAVNTAINETLGRTIVTSLTTFFVVFSLWVFGGSVIENFAFALMVGVVVGTYSSVFIASSLIIEITNYNQKRQDKTKQGGGKKKRRTYEVRPEPTL